MKTLLCRVLRTRWDKHRILFCWGCRDGGYLTIEKNHLFFIFNLQIHLFISSRISISSPNILLTLTSYISSAIMHYKFTLGLVKSCANIHLFLLMPHQEEDTSDFWWWYEAFIFKTPLDIAVANCKVVMVIHLGEGWWIYIILCKCKGFYTR